MGRLNGNGSGHLDLVQIQLKAQHYNAQCAAKAAIVMDFISFYSYPVFSSSAPFCFTQGKKKLVLSSFLRPCYRRLFCFRIPFSVCEPSRTRFRERARPCSLTSSLRSSVLLGTAYASNPSIPGRMNASSCRAAPCSCNNRSIFLFSFTRAYNMPLVP